MELVIHELRGAVSLIRMNRPPRNAVTLKFAEAFDVALREALACDSLALMLVGEGDAFCAGMDLKEVPDYDVDQQRALITQANTMVCRLYGCHKPVVAAVNGHAIGAGLVLALATDYRIGSASESAWYGLTEARSGIPFPAVPAVVVREQLAPADLRFLTLYSKNVRADKMLSMSVFDELSEPQSLFDRALEVAVDMASIPPDSYARIKQQFRKRAENEMQEIITSGSDPMLAGWLSKEAHNAAESVLGRG